MKLKVYGKIFLIMLVDVILLNIALFISLVLRYEFDVSEIVPDMYAFFIGVIVQSIIYSVSAYFASLHNIVWRYANARDLIKLLLVCMFSGLLSFAVLEALNRRLPVSVHIVGCFFGFALMVAFRLILREVEKKQNFQNVEIEDSDGREDENVMIIGGGTAAAMLMHDIKNVKELKGLTPRCIIDDDAGKLGKLIYGVKIVGDRECIAEMAKKYRIDTIIFAIPTCPKTDRTDILNICSQTGCTVKTVPSIDQLLDGKVYVSKIRKVEIEDLLEREPIEINLCSIMDYVKGKTVIVTGGGGSIGSELCRQIAAYSPKKLIIFDIYENSAYDILNEVKDKHPDLDVLALIGSVRDLERLKNVFRKYRPQIVFHAAAHKHVPLMEDSPNEAVKNNVFGTFNTAAVSDMFGVSRFVMISTDKAVNPTNIMGASKRICEMIVQAYNKRSKTDYVAVRFGNVLGSNGSVVPLFKRQISQGGPVTVTHPDVMRYFMTIPEAVSLVLEAGAHAEGGEIFVLDMGKPVRIIELAENLIRLSGFEPYREIEIKFTGLRPGEKLYEELLMSEEGLCNTDNKRIHIGKPIDFDESVFFEMLAKLHDVMNDDGADIRALVKEIVPTYIDAEKKNGEAAKLSMPLPREDAADADALPLEV